LQGAGIFSRTQRNIRAFLTHCQTFEQVSYALTQPILAKSETLNPVYQFTPQFGGLLAYRFRLALRRVVIGYTVRLEQCFELLGYFGQLKISQVIADSATFDQATDTPGHASGVRQIQRQIEVGHSCIVPRLLIDRRERLEKPASS
jgi:hypothetical protein